MLRHLLVNKNLQTTRHFMRSLGYKSEQLGARCKLCKAIQLNWGRRNLGTWRKRGIKCRRLAKMSGPSVAVYGAGDLLFKL